MARTKNPGQKRAERRALRQFRHHEPTGDWSVWMEPPESWDGPSISCTADEALAMRQAKRNEDGGAPYPFTQSPTGQETTMSNDKGGFRAAWKKHRAVRRVKNDAFQAWIQYKEGRLDNEMSGSVIVMLICGVAGFGLASNGVHDAWLLIPAALAGVVMWRLWRLLGKAQDDMEAAGLRPAEPPARATPEQIQAAKEALVGKMWTQAMESGDPLAMAAVEATREATQVQGIAASGEGEAGAQGAEPEPPQEPSA